MKRSGWGFMFVALVLFLTLLGRMTIQASANHLRAASPAEQDGIQKAIYAYFDSRYRSLSQLNLEDLAPHVIQSASGNAFLQAETGKLAVEIHHAQLYRLGYAQYQYTLDFKEISVDPSGSIATASLLEGHDVIFEISKEIAKDKPVVSTLRNLQHTLVLQKDQNHWKLVSDTYDDYLWRFMKKTGLSKTDLLSEQAITPPAGLSQNLLAGGKVALSNPTLCSLPADPSIHPYNSSGAITYAHRWATAPHPYNPKYYDFTTSGGDCTNFISQAILEGSNATMAFGGAHGPGQSGWYYYSPSDYASAWTGVEFLHRFITNPANYNSWSSGPEGCDVQQYLAYPGDLIQYDWQPDGIWDHSVIIVSETQTGPSQWYDYVAGHTPDVDNYPYTNFSYNHPNMVERYIHIDRIDGYVLLELPLIMNNFGQTQSLIQIPIQNAYPAPGPTPTLHPYP
jgi:hypothetical protein